MASSNNSNIKTIPMKVGNDSGLWRFGSLQQALVITNDLIAEVIHTAMELSTVSESKDKNSVRIPISNEV
jgi:hypothetical protein